MRDRDDRHLGPLDQLIRAFHRMLGRQTRPELPAPPDPATYVPDTSPPSPDEQAYAEAAAREVMRRLRRPS
jgi:hypothetical protein